jgi:hypothetical protein
MVVRVRFCTSDVCVSVCACACTYFAVDMDVHVCGHVDMDAYAHMHCLFYNACVLHVQVLVHVHLCVWVGMRMYRYTETNICGVSRRVRAENYAALCE